MYHLFEFAKSGGGVRTISAPDERLKHIQRLLAPLLDRLYSVRGPVHGFVGGKSVKTNAMAHLQKRFVLNLDLADFFPSITENRVIGVLSSLGVDGEVAGIVARLCCLNGHLPQGAPTSPVLSNMICFRMDKQLLAFAKEVRCIYTRYADDMTFSSQQPMTSLFEGVVPPSGKFLPELLVPTLRNILATNGFVPNAAKTHYADRHSRRMVTGLKVNELVNVDRRYVRNIRATIYSIEKLGLPAAQKKFHAQHGGTSDLRWHLMGKIGWLRHIRGQSDPVFRALALRFNSSFPAHPMEVLPSQAEVRDRAVWVVESFEGEMSQGSAFFLEGVGLITAEHCVAHTEEVDVYHPSKRANTFRAKVLKRDKARDLAILEHTIPATEYFELSRSAHSPTVGEQLTAIGYPSFGPGDSLNVREGKVSSLAVKHGIRLIEVSQKLSQGMSGGPVLDGNDTVVGIIHRGGPTEERDFATHVDVLDEWLAE
jgi:S1-C subfamily serine protease